MRQGTAIQRSSVLTGLTEVVFIVILQLDLRPTGQLAVDIRFFEQDPQQSVKVPKSLPQPSSVTPAAPNSSEHPAPSLDIKGRFLSSETIDFSCHHYRHDVLSPLTLLTIMAKRLKNWPHHVQ